MRVQIVECVLRGLEVSIGEKVFLVGQGRDCGIASKNTFKDAMLCTVPSQTKFAAIYIYINHICAHIYICMYVCMHIYIYALTGA